MNLQCEDCHGPAVDHPQDPPKLAINKGREMCLRCHAYLPYPTSLRSRMKGFANPDDHNPDTDCVACHNPHSPDMTAANPLERESVRAGLGNGAQR
jgi:hypothetical protein